MSEMGGCKWNMWVPGPQGNNPKDINPLPWSNAEYRAGILRSPSSHRRTAEGNPDPDPDVFLTAVEKGLDEASGCGTPSEIALLKQYPDTASAQTAYIKHFLESPSLFARNDAEELFKKFLKPSPSVELWKLPLHYVCRMNAFDFALSHIGQDRDSGSIWAEYIQFLNQVETSNPREAQQKMNALRKVYHRAVQTPLDNVEQLWTQFQAFEMGLTKSPQRSTSATSGLHMCRPGPFLANSQAISKGLAVPMAPVGFFSPPCPRSPRKNDSSAGVWKAYLRWEEADPLGIKDEDRSIFTSRVEKVYRKSCDPYAFMAYSWTVSIGKNDDALFLIQAGLEANPESFALTYACVEMLERAELEKDRRDFSEVHTVYERFFGVLRVKLARLREAVAPADEANKDENKKDIITTVKEVSATTGPPGLVAHHEELVERKEQYSNAWINYIRFAWRAQGSTAGRKAFANARNDGLTGWQVYEAAEDGRMVATRIFEIGMKQFVTDVSLTINDRDKARALFERVAGKFSPQEAKPIWERWSQSQYQYDELEAALELERRMAEIYPNDAPIKRFAQRHTHHSIDAIADSDLGFAKTRKFGAVNSGVSNQNPSVPPPRTTKRSLPPTDHRQNDYKRPRRDERDRGGMRYSPPPQSPAWKRDHNRKPPREKEKPAGLPTVLNWFVTQLPPQETFDGPFFNIDNLMDTLKKVVIPSSTNRARPPPPKPAGRPLPDYGPYQGPQSWPPKGVGRHNGAPPWR
ncbi:Suf-domain-containing protein [Mycena olivaceomarginata]|nr:Suf-domain-containing protein [Mycena olivaceomarginata]